MTESRLGSPAMRMRKGFVGLLVLLGLLLPATASADQQQDWFISGARDEGTYLSLDLLIGAIQATLENDTKVYGNANQLTLRGNALAALPFGKAGVGFDMRIVVLSLGMDVGMQSVWRGIQCGVDSDCNRKERREIEASGDFTQHTFPYWEGRAQLVLPFNDYALFVAQTNATISDAPDGLYDYQNNIMRDGSLVLTNLMLFAKHKDFGGLAPMVQHMAYSIYGRSVSQWNFGFTFLTRAGLVRDDDLIILRMTFHDPDFLGGDRMQDVFGNELLRGPLTLLFVYRSVITL